MVPEWASDSMRVAFACHRNGSASRVHVVTTNGAQGVVPPSASASDTAPHWAPDGGRLAFARRDTAAGYGTDGRIGIWTAAVTGVTASDLRRLTAAAETADHPRWSPDGRRVLYVAPDERGLRPALRVIPAGGGGPTTLWTAPAGELVQLYAAEWSPDGARVAFRSAMA
jgi:TolB protein